MNTQKNIPLSDFRMEQYLEGALPAHEMRELRKRESGDEIFAARVREMQEQNKKILEENPFEILEKKIIHSGEIRSRDQHTGLLKVAALLVVSLGIFSVVFHGAETAGGTENAVQFFENANGEEIVEGTEVAMALDLHGGTRLKGMQPRMEIWKKSGNEIVLLENMSEVSEGDEIQLRYSVPEKCYGMIFSMDGNGALTVHVGNDNVAIPLEPGRMVSLPYAYKLDDAPQFEKFFLLTSATEFSVFAGKLDEILNQENLVVTTVTLQKKGR